MPLLHLVILALVQGVTEFLPISSSGHLILVPLVADWPDQGLMIDVAVHVGTLLAVLIYLWRDIWEMSLGLFRALKGRRTPGLMMIWYLLVGTVPPVVVGLAIHEYAGDALRSAEIIGWATLLFGVLLYIADKVGMTILRLEHMTTRNAFLIGLSQILAFIPGTSRSGITMTIARFLGFERVEAARFSMLLSIPTIIGAGALVTKDIVEAGNAQLTHDAIFAGGLAFVAALVTIILMMGWLRRASFTPFVIYRLILGVALLSWVYFF
ncbi:undecaprenyl-diphosphate phosphatase [Oceanibaculum pacificum]|uniref:Undecaprenyl-diphosphatase n=1 Tax=Oceanibaculum pacificum TaxID=580166 RepID=A0A154WBW7_9PROT|nr:undecaprenyl-diphosphate phosphatase [Oceanibaculum pacificum]KZD11021.1 undecaprenyl-diphosphatase [Oceanibaculum pacificum]